jgi:phage FluMu protein Com
MAAETEFRCGCGALLARLARVPGTDVRIKCRRCKTLCALQVPVLEQAQPSLRLLPIAQ